ncbi:MAG: hypothetical protein AAFX76_03545 [Planctomycetota bacterium]
MSLAVLRHTEPRLASPTEHAAAVSSDTTTLAWHPDGWCFRGVATALSLAVSGAYAVWGFEALGFVGASVLLAAGLAWPALLAGVWMASPRGLRRSRIDWCVWTMAVGSTAMAIGLTACLVLAAQHTTPSVHPWLALVGGVLLADVAMGWVFTRYAPTVGVRRWTAVGVWVVGMNGFLLAVVGLAIALERLVTE